MWGGVHSDSAKKLRKAFESTRPPLVNSHPNRVGDAMFHARYVPASMSQVPAFISQNIGLRPIQIGYTTITLFMS